MKQPDCPLNVVIYAPAGSAENYDCTGPTQLREWLKGGRVTEQTAVFAKRSGEWMTVASYLNWSERKSDVETLSDMDATLTNLVGVAEELKRLTELASKREASKHHDRSRDFREYRKTERTNGDTNRDDDHNRTAVCRAVPGAGSY